MPGNTPELPGGLAEIHRRVRGQYGIGQGAEQGAHHPAHDDGVADGNTQGTQKRDPAQSITQLSLAAGGPAVFVGPQRAGPGPAPDGELRRKAHQAEQCDKDRVRNQERSPAVLAHPVREHPDISHTHGRSHASQDKAQARLETAVLVAFMFLGSVALKTIPHYISPLRIFYLYRLADNRGLVKPIISLFPTASPRSPPPPWTTGSPPAPGPRWRRDSRSRTGCGRRSC